MYKQEIINYVILKPSSKLDSIKRNTNVTSVAMTYG